MQTFKLVLTLAAMSMAGQALAHKASRASATTVAPARLMPAQTDTNPAALLDSIGGRSVQGTTAMPGAVAQAPLAKSTVAVTRINPSH